MGGSVRPVIRKHFLFNSSISPLVLTLAAAVLAIVLVSAPAAQAQVSAAISGRVTDPTGAAVSGATVTVKNVDTGVTRTAMTDDAGRYSVLALPVGDYEVRTSKQGFLADVHGGVHLVVGQEATVDAALRVGQITEQVSVIADAPIVNLTTTDISGVVAEQQVTDLPLNGRSYDELMTLNPGVVNFTWEKTGGIGVSNSTAGNMFSVAGNRPQQNLFLLNGIEYTGAAENNMQPGGTSQQLLGVDAVREFNILQNGYSAEYGKHPGGQVIILTRSGTNQWHGTVFEFLRNSALDAPNYFDQGAAPPFHRNQFGGSLGGPIQKDKTFVFANYEGYRQRLDQTSVAFVPDASARAGTFTPLGSACPTAERAACATAVASLLNLWPVANGPDQGSGIAEYFGTPLQTVREDFGTARVDRNFSSKDALGVVYTGDDSADNTATAINPYMSDVTSLREQVVSIEETHVFSPDLLNTARAGFSRAGYFFTGEPTPGTPAASIPGFVPGLPIGAVVVGGSAASNPAAQVALAGSNNGSNLSVHRNLFTYEDRVSWIKGRNEFKFGAWVQRFQSNENIALSQYGQATFPSLSNFLQGTLGTGSFLIDPTSTPLSWRSLFAAFYAEDAIRVSSQLTVSLGLREESSTGWNEAYGRASNYGFTAGVINTQPSIGNSVFTVNNAKFLPQPRIGLAWSPFGSKTVLRAGFGMYNDLQDALGYRTDQNAPFNPSYSIPNLTVDKFPITAPIVATSAGTASPAGTKLVPGGVQPDLQTPTLISYNLKMEREITPNTSLTLGYLGSHGYHELVGVDANIPPTVTCPAACNRANNSIANTWSWFSEGDSLYNAMTVDVNHRFSAGLIFRGSYTWSKALDDGDSLNATAAANAPALLSNPLNPKADWGPATFDVRNIAVISVSYALPVGEGKRHVSEAGWGNTLLGGWTLNSIITAQSGFPLTPQLSFNPTNDGDSRNPVRPSWNTGTVAPALPGQWFNPNQFVVPAAGTFGNVGRDVLPGPGLATWDFSAMKETRLTERFHLQFRAEIFNLLNRTNFGVPNLIVFTSASAAPSPVAGTFTNTSTTSRQVQFGLKMLW